MTCIGVSLLQLMISDMQGSLLHVSQDVKFRACCCIITEGCVLGVVLLRSQCAAGASMFLQQVVLYRQ